MHKKHELRLDNGNVIYINPDDARAKALIETNGHLNIASKKTWLHIFKLTSWDYVIDVGGNYGEMTACLNLEGRTIVYCYEANSEITEFYLTESIDRIGNKNIIVKNIALGDEEKDNVNFYIDTKWSGTSGLTKDASVKLHKGLDSTKVVQIKVRTLDQEINTEGASLLIKIDVEGSEQAVLKGALNNLTSCKSCMVMFEALHLGYPALLELMTMLPAYKLCAYHLESQSLQEIPMASETDFDNFRSLPEFNHQDYVFEKNIQTALPPPPSIKGRRYVVYTALIGNDYEEINISPFPDDDNCDYICFTNIQTLTSTKWNIIQVTPYFPRDNIRSARYLKIMGPLLLGQYEASLWIDNSVSLKKHASEIIDDWLSDTDIALPDHSFRSSIAAEFEAVESAGFDDPSRIYEQLIAYANSDQQSILEKPFWTAILARRHTENNFSFLLRWWSHVLRYSRRDQLSFNYAAKEEKISAKRIMIDNHSSEFHVWPAIKHRNRKLTSEKISSCLRIPFMDVGQIHNELTRQEILINRLHGELESLRARESLHK